MHPRPSSDSPSRGSRPGSGHPRGGLALWPTLLLVTLLLSAAPAAAQEALGFRFGMGGQTIGGELGEALDSGVDAEFDILWALERVRLGVGFNWVSVTMDDIDDQSWSKVAGHLLLAWPFRVGPARSYVEGRFTWRRLRPEDDRFFMEEVAEEELRDFVSSGIGAGAVVGVEIPLGEATFLDLSLGYDAFGLSPNLTEEGLGPIDSGSMVRLHLGVTWFPLAGVDR